MRQTITTISYTILVVVACVLLCLFIPALSLLEMFLVLLGGLIIAQMALIVAREAQELAECKHRDYIQRKCRELKLEHDNSEASTRVVARRVQNPRKRRRLYYY